MALVEARGPAQEMEVELEIEALEQLEALIAKPSYLHTLEKAASYALHFKTKGQQQVQHHPLLADEQQEPEVDVPPEGWEHATIEAPPIQPALALGFELVDKEDAVEAMAYYIAQCLAKHPEAQIMSPKQLQEALTTALRSLKQSRFKRAWAVGRHAYRWTTLTYSALQMWQNPWLVQAVLTALWTFSRISLRVMLR